MNPIIHFGCPACSTELEAPAPGPDTLNCPHCGHAVSLARTPSVKAGDRVDTCAVCGHPDMYVQKDFNRSLGMLIVVVGISGSLILFAVTEPLFAVGALVLMALVDGLLYLLVGEVTVCYSCHAIYRGFGPNPEHEPFSLELLERYGGRTPRR